MNQTTYADRASVADLEFYGTEEATPVPIQIGGGNIDRVANFRVYDKFVGEDQALEIWDAQKDTFRGVKNSMTLHKGYLGLGTEEPEGRLAILDEPHNLEEFPPRAMTDYKTYFEGHGEFCASASSEYTATPRLAWKAFNKSSENIDDGWMHVNHYTGVSSGTASGTTPTFTGSITLAEIAGEWISLEFPYKVKLNGFKITSYHDSTFRGLNDGFLLGRNDKNSEWIRVHEITNLYAVYNTRDAPQLSAEVSFTNDTYYNEYALIATSTTGHTVWTAIELKYFGTREQRQSVLHDGQLTLTKNLDVPRIGPPLDADDTPRRDRLVVEYNTSSNPTFEGAVRDTSGRGNDGVFYGGASYDATEKALVFDGTDDYLQTRLDNYAGDWVHSFSFWFNGNNLSTTTRIDPIQIGPGDGLSGTSQYSAIDMYTDRVNWYFYGNDLNDNYTTVNNGKWYHLCCIYEGGGLVTKRHVYLNGAEISTATTGGTDLNLAANSTLSLGGDLGRNSSYFNGSISNFKLYDTALTAQEVKTLYDMGRNGSVANPQPLHIAAPLYAPGVPVQIVSKVYKKQAAYSSTSSYRNIKELDISIKPKFANSRILLHWMINCELHQDTVIRAARDGSYIIHGYNEIQGTSRYSGIAAGTFDQNQDSTPANFCIDTYDEPGGTNTYNYQIYIGSSSTSSYPAYINRTYNRGGGDAFEAGICFMSATEIAQ